MLTLLLTAAGYDAPGALRALWNGAAGSPYAFLSGTLVRATPLLLAGLAVTLAFQAGVLNIGAEGQFLAGATAAASVALAIGAQVGPFAAPVALAAALVGGALWAWPAAYLRRRFGVLEVISTIMLNFIALYAVSYVVRGPLQEPLHIYPQTAAIPRGAELPRFGTTRLHAGFVVALAAASGLWWAQRATAIGFRVRAAGANPFAAASAGLVDVGRTATMAFLASGALAGLAGGVELCGVTYALYENISPGYGYTAIAVALLARLDPAAVIVSAVLFGALEAGASAMQRDAGVPSVVVSVVEATMILTLLAADRLRHSTLRVPHWSRGGPPSTRPDVASDAAAPPVREPNEMAP